MRLGKLNGESLKSWIQLDDDWHAKALPWQDAAARLEQYIDLEMLLLEHGVMYRDLNLDHVVFTETTARIVDLEASLLTRVPGAWRLTSGDSRRGTWETMALEEFRRPAILTSRTATYRSAVIAHLVLASEVPFARKARKSDTRQWRAAHAPHCALELDKPVRRVLANALSREPSRRHKDPAHFFDALRRAHEQRKNPQQ